VKKGLLILLILTFLITACKDDQAETNNQEKGDSNPSQLTDTYPLTGMAEDNAVDNRIVAVMVNNHEKARPQTGLSQADIVFEILAEGKITRFLALYQSELPPVVGPVRSAREYYSELAQGYNAIYVYHGAADFINQSIQDRGIDHLNGSLYDNEGLFKRETFRQAPHNSYLQLDELYDEAEAKGYQTTADYSQMLFLQEGEKVTGDEALTVEIVYSENPMEIVEYQFDKSTQVYTRFNDHQQTVEMDSEKPIEISNVFIIETKHEVIDDEGRRSIDLASGGDAYLLQQGVVQKLQWEKLNGRIVPVKEGKEVPLTPGKTWINVIPEDPGLDTAVTLSSE
jgi:hypothetical protein